MKLTAKTLFKLMDLRTLVAGIIPVIFGTAYSLYRYDQSHWSDFLILLLGIVLVQSSTNMLNDLYDHERGADDRQKADEKALASGEISRKQVKQIIWTFLLIDIVIALFYSITRHWSIALVVVTAMYVMYRYSGGKKPISYSPFGEITAGSTMGFGIMTTVIYIQSLEFNIETILVAVPTSLYIGTILLTNNISDWREDRAAGRRTLPILIGVDRAEKLWAVILYGIIFITGIYTVFGLFPWVSFVLTLVMMPYRQINLFLTMEKNAVNKGRMMGLIGKVGVRYHMAMVLGLMVAYVIL